MTRTVATKLIRHTNFLAAAIVCLLCFRHDTGDAAQSQTQQKTAELSAANHYSSIVDDPVTRREQQCLHHMDEAHAALPCCCKIVQLSSVAIDALRCDREDKKLKSFSAGTKLEGEGTKLLQHFIEEGWRLEGPLTRR